MLGKPLREHGPDLPAPELAVRLAADRPKAQATDPTLRCWVRFPQLIKLAVTQQPAAK